MADQLEYPIQGKGVYIIMKLCRHRFSAPWDGLVELDYETDKKKILKTFNLTIKSHNLLVVEDLTKEPGPQGFDTFMEEFKEELIAKDPDNEEPSFVMFILMSHGIMNGGFLLATPEDKKGVVEPCKCDPNNHIADSSCYVRYITKNLMDKVSKAYSRPEVPKIYLMQTCRGNERNITKLSGADQALKCHKHIAPSENELFVLKQSDSFLLRPCVEGNGCWAGTSGTRTGSFLIKYFCYALDDLRQSSKQLAKNVDELLETKGDVEGSHPVDELLTFLNAENLQGGWLTNVCERTNSIVTSILVKEVMDTGWEMALDKQQPHYSSSLAYKFSCLKMLKTQWGEKDAYLADWYQAMQEAREEEEFHSSVPVADD